MIIRCVGVVLPSFTHFAAHTEALLGFIYSNAEQCAIISFNGSGSRSSSSKSEGRRSPSLYKTTVQCTSILQQQQQMQDQPL